MKKLFLLSIIMFWQTSFAQLEIIGSDLYGRIQYLNYDPIIANTIYASTLGNHIVVSRDNGQTWEILYSYPNSDFAMINNLKMHNSNELSFSIRIRNTNNNKIYILDKTTGIITREYTVPIFSGTISSSVYKWDFYNDDTIIAILHSTNEDGSSQLVYYTNDGGDSWNLVYQNLDQEEILPQNVAISPTNPSKLFITRSGGAFGQTGGLYISDNAGQTWFERLPNIDFNAIAFNPSNPNEILLGTYLTNANQNLFRSVDNGATWDLADSNWSTDVTDSAILDIKYNPFDSNNIIVLGASSIILTFDNFQTKDVFNFPNEIENPNNYYHAFTVSFNPFNTNEIIISNNDYPLRSVDRGQTVTRIKNPFFFSLNGQLNLFKNSTNKHLYYSIQNGYSHRNLNALVETPYGITPLQSFPFTNNKFYTDEYHEGRIYGYYESTFLNSSVLSVSNNHGESIIGISLPKPFLHAITSKPDNPNLLLCSSSDVNAISSLIQFDISNPDNIQQSEITLPAQGLLLDFHFEINNPSKLWIALGNSIFKTLDYGATWIQQNNGLTLLPTDKIYQISQNPLNLNQLTLATTAGIFTSLDSGNSWSQMITQEIHSVKHSDSNNNHIIALTFDTEFTSYALRYSNDAGITWNQVQPSNLLYINSDMKSSVVDFVGNNAEIYISTFDIGVLKYTINLSTLSNPGFESDKIYTLHPNPTDSILYIHASNFQNEFTITLYDTVGKKIKEIQNADRIQLQEMQSGIYYLRIQSQSGQIETHKIIKK